MRHYAVINTETSKVYAQSRSGELIHAFYTSMAKSKRNKSQVFTFEMNDNARKLFEEANRDVELWEEDFLGEQVYEEVEDLYSFAKEEYSKLELVIKDLDNIVSNYSMHKEDKKTLKKAKVLLEELSKKKNFKKAIGFDVISSLERDNKAGVLRKLFALGGKKYV